MILFSNLGETLGFFSTYKRSKFIHINHKLDYCLQKFVCAHELGHAMLHPGINTPFLKASTLFSVHKLEREANKFAVELLMPDDLLREYSYLSIYEIARMVNVPQEVVHLKNYECFW